MYRGTFAIIDETAIQENVAAIRASIAESVKVLVAVKANGYGHGMIQAAGAALAGGADYLGVATLEEALALRTHFRNVPILVLGVVFPRDAKVAAKYQIDITVTEDWAVIAADQHYSPPLRIHLKVDTGMTRLGFRSPAALSAAAKWFRRRTDIEIVGVFSHLACADATNQNHSEQQVRKFETYLKELGAELRPEQGAEPRTEIKSHEENGEATCNRDKSANQNAAGKQPIMAHIANSAAALRNPEWHFDMVRVGISAYGFPPGDGFPIPVKLRQAMNVYSFITRVADVEAGETVGYGATYRVTRSSSIATVPIGYGDGYPRHLSNLGYVLLRGQRVPVVGNVCMDQLMVDVTEIPDVKVGECVTLYGRVAPGEWHLKKIEDLPAQAQTDYLTNSFRQSVETDGSAAFAMDAVSIHDLALLAGTISYELVCSLSDRVPHLYTGLNNSAEHERTLSSSS